MQVDQGNGPLKAQSGSAYKQVSIACDVISLNIYKALNLLNVFLSVEQPCSIVTSLENVQILEKETAFLKIVLSKPRQVKWMKGSEVISGNDDRFRASVSDSGFEHSLTISNISTQDSGIVTAEVDDKEYESITSSSTIAVKGMRNV